MKLLLFLLLAISSSSGQLSPNGRQQVLDFHNKLRSQVALGVFSANGTIKPPARNMERLTYGQQFERLAQDYVADCPDGLEIPIGRNIGMNYYTTKVDETYNSMDEYVIDALNDWAEEFQVNGWLSTIYNDTSISAASQMVWAGTKYVGCGVKRCDPINVVVVCMYYQQGNLVGRPIYKEGPPCTACPPMRICPGQKECCDRVMGLCT
ncbi:SCP domain-containing protein [Caenorhabditis elegans]|uniref:SCP domain-containing protein n=1 Tax=Caenorhabditis elegans TaxID=6239 RepID=O62507_CAEEL|nr:SCP domain-containing protein [Caenorhabditis elegans]CAB05010.2 SCP domain-containing protein [Caenorhabditis elegans]|eukprot:NP_507654.2 SCP-Like extracellular protein [Caenorhabditis elegans]